MLELKSETTSGLEKCHGIVKEYVDMETLRVESELKTHTKNAIEMLGDKIWPRTEQLPNLKEVRTKPIRDQSERLEKKQGTANSYYPCDVADVSAVDNIECNKTRQAVQEKVLIVNGEEDTNDQSSSDDKQVDTVSSDPATRGLSSSHLEVREMQEEFNRKLEVETICVPDYRNEPNPQSAPEGSSEIVITTSPEEGERTRPTDFESKLAEQERKHEQEIRAKREERGRINREAEEERNQMKNKLQRLAISRSREKQ